MASERFRDPITGRWVTRETVQSSNFDFVRELFEGGKRTDADVYSQGETEGLFGRRAVPNWNDNDVPWGRVWSTQLYYGGEPDGIIEPLNKAALEDADYPGGQFRVVYAIPDNPDYPRGYGSTAPLMESEWPPNSSFGDIVAIHFYTY